MSGEYNDLHVYLHNLFCNAAIEINNVSPQLDAKSLLPVFTTGTTKFENLTRSRRKNFYAK
jgi:hypothetical protein